MKKLLAAWGFVMLSILGASVWYLFGPGTAPEGQPPLLSLAPGNLSRLQSDFNAASEKIRIVAVLSPTRIESLHAASAIQILLTEFEGAPIFAQIIWEPQLDSDWAPPATEVMARVWDTRTKQYWDKGHLVSSKSGPLQFRIYTRGAAWRDEMPPPGLTAESASASIDSVRAYLRALIPAQTARPPVVGMPTRAI